MKLKIVTLCLLLGSISAFAQKGALNGTWKLEAVSVVKIQDNSQLGFDEAKQNPHFGLFDELMFKGNNLTITDNGNKTEGTAKITGDRIEITFVNVPFDAEYRISDGFLHLQQHISFPGEGHPENNIYRVSSVYKR